jgi:AMMECR1 domain-containing protein
MQANDDRDFKMKHEAAVRSISQLKNEIDALRAELRDKKLEIADLEGDSTSLKQQLDEKSIELENHKNDLKGCIGTSFPIQPTLKNWLRNARASTTLPTN